MTDEQTNVEQTSTSQDPSTDYVKNRITEFLGDDDATTPHDTKPTEETVETKPDNNGEDTQPVPEKADEKQSKTEEVKEEVKPFDPEAFKKDLTQTLTKEITNSIVQKMTGTNLEQIKKEAEDKPIWEKEQRNPTYQELADYLTDNAVKRLEAKQQEEQAKVEAEQKAAAEKQEAYNKQMNTYWDRQLDQLEKTGKIKPEERTEIQLQMYNKAMEAKKAGRRDYTIDLNEFYLYEYQPKNTTPPGAQAPVAGGRTSSEGEKPGFKYEEVHNSDWHDILGGK